MNRRLLRTLLLLSSAAACLAAPTTGYAATLLATVGPGYDISLTTRSGTPVRTIAAGRVFDIVVRDRSTQHNFRLTGPGVVRQTSVAFQGTTRPWRVTFTRGTWTYLCQPHSLSMQGTISVL